MNRLSTKLFARVVLALTFVTAVCWLYFYNSVHRDTLSELQMGSGMGPNLMTSQNVHGTVDYNALTSRIEEANGTSEWRSGPTLTVSVGCTAEDIFGSREAYIAFFETNEDDEKIVDETPSDSIDK
jgi:hypothetical protein